MKNYVLSFKGENIAVFGYLPRDNEIKLLYLQTMYKLKAIDIFKPSEKSSQESDEGQSLFNVGFSLETLGIPPK